MARQQIYRGNPEEKKYLILDNFSGGMNTTAIDDAMLTNEYRNLENVDLSETGLIKNRKGFEKLPVLNALLAGGQSNGDYAEIRMETFSNYSLIRIISDEQNAFEIMKECVDLNEFETRMQSTPYTIKILFIAQESTTTKVLLLIINENNDVWLWNKKDFGVLTTNTNITGITVINFEDKLYVPLNQINNTLTGFGVYSTDAETFEVIDNLNNFYVPNPYEVSNVGFNLLAANPLNEISMYESGSAEIRGLLLTDINNDNVVLSNIPLGGIFTLNVIFKGSLLASDLIPHIYVTDNLGNDTDLDFDYIINDDNERDGILKYDLNVRIEDNKEINIEVRKLSQSVDYDIDFVDTNSLLAYYKDDTKKYLTKPTISLFNCYTPNLTNNYGYDIMGTPANTRLIGGTNYTTQNASAVNLPYYTVDILGALIPAKSPNYIQYNNMLTYAIQKTDGTETYKYRIIHYNDSGQIDYIDTPNSPYDNITFNGGVINDILDYIPEYSTVIRVGVDPTYTYYRYNGETDGVIADFTEQSAEDLDLVILSYISTYDVVQENELKEIESLDTSDIDIIEIKNRLVIYSGNTIFFSDLFKFNYFPNYNYIILSLESDDSIQKIAYFRGSYIIFTKERIYRMSGEFGMDDFKIVLINDSLGCVSPNSVRSMNNTLIFLSRDGLYVIKQNFYMDGLENVEKVDKQIKDVIPYSTNHESLVYNEQYLLFMKDSDNNYYKTLKQYYNIEYRTRAFPYVLDEYVVSPDNLFTYNGLIYSIKNGLFYVYDEGYTDFLPETYLEADVVDYTYKMSITTPNYSLGYPTHEKKFKNLYIKTDSEAVVPVYVTLFINNSVWKTPYEFAAIVNGLGEIEYYEILGTTDTTTVEAESNLVTVVEPELDISTIDPDLVLGAFDLGIDKLGVNRYQVHKIIVAGKGKTLAMRIEQKLNEYFAIQDIGILYKLGKVRESR